MSRIEEALKRVSNFEGASNRAEPFAAGDDDSSLDRYPRERHGLRPARDAASKEVAPVLAQASRAGIRTPEFDAGVDVKIVGAGMDAVSLEQYRRLAAVLIETRSQRGIGSLMITSALPREGKTLTATNLALTLSESYARRILLIDADLRRPAVHEVFRLPNATGLSDGLRANHSQLAIVQVTRMLAVLPAGRPDANPMAGLSSERMKNLIVEAKSRFDWVIVDSPPIGILPDAQLVSQFMDAVLLVIGAGTTPYAAVQRAIAEVGADRLIGTILNRVAPNAVSVAEEYSRYYADPSPQLAGHSSRSKSLSDG